MNYRLLLALSLALMACGDSATEPGATEEETPVDSVGSVTAVWSGTRHTMILDADGTLWATGANGAGQLGDSTTTNRSTPVRVTTGVAAVAAGGVHTLILKTDGTLWATGANWSGQLADGTTTARSEPAQVMTGVAAMSAGYAHTMIVKTDGTLWASGLNSSGQLGDGTITSRSTPVQVMNGVAAVSAGWDHSMILKTDSTLWAAGSNYYGQFGDGTYTGGTTPTQVMDSVAGVSAGGYITEGLPGGYTMILKTDGTLWAAGRNYYGQLGDGTLDNRSTPVQVMVGVTMVSAFATHTMILQTDGTLWGAGRNDYGQLGASSTDACPGFNPVSCSTTPVQVMTDVLSVSVGELHTMILQKDQTLLATGYNRDGQHGDGTTTDKSTPVQVIP